MYLLKISILIAIIVLVLPATASAAFYYLDAINGSDANPGSSSAPWQSLSRAQAVVKSGDVVLLNSGNYGPFNEIHSSNPSRNNWITYRAQAGHTPVFEKIYIYNTQKFPTYLLFDGIDILVPVPDPWPDPQSPPWPKTDGVTIGNADFVKLQNCTVRGNSKYLTRHGIKITMSDNVEIYRCDISNIGAGTIAIDCKNHKLLYNHIHTMSEGSGVRIQASRLSPLDVTGTLIQGNHIHGQDGVPTDDYYPDGFHPGSAISIRVSNVTFSENIIHDGFSQGIMFYVDEPGLMPYQNMVLENNLFYDTGFNRLRNVGGPMRIVNNTFVGCVNDDRVDNKYGILARYSGVPLHIDFTSGFDASDVIIYNNVIVGPWGISDPDKYNYLEDNNIFWVRGGDPYYQNGKGSNTFMAVWRDNTTPYALHGYPEFFEDLDLSFNCFTPEYPGGVPPTPFFIDPHYYTNKQTTIYRDDCGKTCDYHLAPGSPAVNFGNAAYQPTRSLGTIDENGFILQDGPTRDATRHSVGCYEYDASIPENEYLLTINTIGSGYVNKNPNKTSYTSGEVVSLQAIPGDGYVFDSWSGNLTGSTNPASITMNTHKYVTANFSPAAPVNEYLLTINTNGSGYVNKTPDKTSYTSGEVVSLQAIPGNGYVFDSWSGDLSGSSNPASITTTANKSVTANFSAAPAPDNQLVAHWKFDEAAGTNAQDSSESSNNATIINAPVWTTGKINSALQFDGLNDYVNCSDAANLNFSSALTITAWIKIANPSQSRYMRIVSKKNIWNAPTGYELEYNPYKNTLTALAGGNNYAQAANVNLDSTWHHVAAVIDGTTAKLYVDGQNKTTDPTLGTLLSNTYALQIGRQSASADYFNGSIDDVRIYNYALTGSDILQIYNETPADPPEPTNSEPTANSQSVSLQEDATKNITLTATDPDNDTLNYTIVSPPVSGSLSGTAPNLTYQPNQNYYGSDSFSFKANDGQADSNIASVSITISPENDQPVFDPIENQFVVKENTTLTFSLTATDPDGDAITYTMLNAPDGATYNSPFTWTPSSSDAGTYQITFTASDGLSEDSQTITIIVENDNQSPDISALPDTITKAEGATITKAEIELATDPDGDSLTYTYSGFCNNLPYTTTNDDAGTYTLNVTVSDGSESLSKTIDIIINNINRAPILNSPGDITISENTTATFLLSAVDPDGDPIEYSASPLPKGALFSGNTFTWRPSHENIGTHPIVLTATDGWLYDYTTIAITVIGGDNTPPTVLNCSPEPYAHETPRNCLISVQLTDEKTGIDPNSVNIRVDDNLVYIGNTEDYSSPYGRCRRSGDQYCYTFTYQAAEFFGFDHTINVAVNAADRFGNTMNEFTYLFYTETRSFGIHTMVSPSTINLIQNQPCTATDSAGNIYVVYQAGLSDKKNIYLAYLAPGADQFSAPIAVTKYESARLNPVIALDANDKIYIAWQEKRRGQWDIHLTSSSDLKWPKPVRIAKSKQNETNPALIIDHRLGNRAYLAFQSDQQGNQDIYMAISDNAFASKTVHTITTNAADQTSPALTVDSNNTVYILWTDKRNGSDDIYGADSVNGPWTNLPVVTNQYNQSQPAITASPQGSLHLLWTDDSHGDKDIFYAAADTLTSPLTGVNIIDDSSHTDQLTPSIIAAAESDGAVNIFACWQDNRNNLDGNDDSDIYFVEIASGAGTNVLVTDDNTSAAQSLPAIGIDAHAAPYIVWTDSRNINTDIYYAGSTGFEAQSIARQYITAQTGGTVGTESDSIQNLDDVSVEIPPAASASDAEISIARINNPKRSSLKKFRAAHEIGPSGMTFTDPVTITIPYQPEQSDTTPLEVFWYNPQTGQLSKTGITNEEHIAVSPALSAVQFETNHFSQFIVGSKDDSQAPVGDGCSMSRYHGHAGIIDFILPYLAFFLTIYLLKRRDIHLRPTR